MENHQIAILVNPLAKRKVVSAKLELIKKILSDRKIAFDVFDTKWPQNINTYTEAWIIGGDGTLNYLLNAYSNINIPLVIFKGGTGNDFATGLYGKMNVLQQVEHVLNAKAKHVDAAECNGRKFINGLGIGFDGEVLKAINKIRLIGGHLGYLWIVIQKIFSYQEAQYVIAFNGRETTGKFLLVMITNSSTTGGGFIVSPEAKINDGKLNMILCNSLSVFKRLKYLPVIEKGKHLKKEFINHQTINAISVTCEKETLAQIDGELFSAQSFEIKVLPRYCMFKY